MTETLVPVDAAENDIGPDFVEGLARGLRVIAAFKQTQRQMTLSEVARAVDLPRPSVRRALLTLASLGFIDIDGRSFRLTPKILTIASAYLGSNMISDVVQPVCERIAQNTGEACFAAVMDRHSIVFIAHATPWHSIRLAPAIGLRIPAFSTAAGRVIVSQYGDDEMDKWLAGITPRARTEFTVTDKRRLRAAILKARADGHCLSDKEATLDYRAIACPLRRRDGQNVGALSLTIRVTEASKSASFDSYVDMLKEEAAKLQEQLI
jgi:IclR family pca regulon transcriptional regulator